VLAFTIKSLKVSNIDRRIRTELKQVDLSPLDPRQFSACCIVPIDGMSGIGLHRGNGAASSGGRCTAYRHESREVAWKTLQGETVELSRAHLVRERLTLLP
jgi:hypothetical protein